MRHRAHFGVAALLCCAVLATAAKTYAGDDDKKPADSQTVTLKIAGMT